MQGRARKTSISLQRTSIGVTGHTISYHYYEMQIKTLDKFLSTDLTICLTVRIEFQNENVPNSNFANRRTPFDFTNNMVNETKNNSTFCSIVARKHRKVIFELHLTVYIRPVPPKTTCSRKCSQRTKPNNRGTGM